METKIMNYIVYKLWVAYYYIMFLFEYLGWYKPFNFDNLDLDYKRIFKTRYWFFRRHLEINQRYGNRPYFYHLNMVGDVVVRYYRWFNSSYNPEVFYRTYETALGHDILEDHYGYSYNDIKAIFGEYVAENIYYLSELRGKNRRERHSAEYYEGIRKNYWSNYVKLCDIYCNIKHSKKSGSGMFDKYIEEWRTVRKALYNKKLEFIIDDIDYIIKN